MKFDMYQYEDMGFSLHDQLKMISDKKKEIGREHLLYSVLGLFLVSIGVTLVGLEYRVAGIGVFFVAVCVVLIQTISVLFYRLKTNEILKIEEELFYRTIYQKGEKYGREHAVQSKRR